MQTAKAVLKFLLFILLCGIVVPVQSIVLLFHKGRYAYIVPYLWQKGVAAIFGITVKQYGTPVKTQQTIFISNHISYLDIPAIGSILKASFVAKQDVESWPVFGFLSKLQQTAFISRARADVKNVRYALDTMLEDGKSLIIFPEGTSTDGTDVVPFKSSLFSLALKENLPDLVIQPMTLRMETTNGGEIKTQDDRDLYSWHNKMDTPLAGHLWRFAKSKGAEISVIFHAPLKTSEFSDRKTLAKTCHEAVCNGLGSNT